MDNELTFLICFALYAVIALILYVLYNSILTRKKNEIDQYDKLLAYVAGVCFLVELISIFFILFVNVSYTYISFDDLIALIVLASAPIRVFYYKEKIRGGFYTFLILLFIAQIAINFFIVFIVFLITDLYGVTLT